MDDFDVAVIGAGPAGLAVALNLVRARRRVVLIDSGEPRHAVTTKTHGFITRDGTPPLEFRRLGREEFSAYEGSFVLDGTVTDISRQSGSLVVTVDSDGHQHDVAVPNVVLATGLRESFPDIPSLATFYGVTAHSCIDCDGYEYRDKPLALIGETEDLGERAVLLTQWSKDIVVLTNGRPVISEWWKTKLTEQDIRVDERAIADIEGGSDGVLTGIRFSDGEVLAREGVFVRPHWKPNLAFIESLGVVRSMDGLVTVDNDGRTSEPGLWAIGDITPPGPEQLLIAAGAGQKLASVINRTLLGLK